MRTAALLGLPVPPVRYHLFAGEAALVTDRFDRLSQPDHHTRRLHQEDLCQALGLWRTMKYQVDGGPSAATILATLREVLDPRDRERGVVDFVQAQVFNWLTAGTDAHAKNYALLHLGTRVVLAPFYDLLSAAFLQPSAELHFEGRLAMKFGGEHRLRKVDAGRYEQAAAGLGVDADFLIATARTYRDHLPDALASALNDLPDNLASGRRDAMVDAIAARLTDARVP